LYDDRSDCLWIAQFVGEDQIDHDLSNAILQSALVVLI
jgi:hypothetical protein